MFTLMQNLSKGKWLTILLIALAMAVLRILIQPFIPTSINPAVMLSPIAKAGLVLPAYLLFCTLIYSLLAVVFVLVQGRLPGKKTAKGLLFGLAFGIMWWVYLLEPLPTGDGVTLVQMLALPFADGTPIMLLGILLGRFVGTDSPAGGKIRQHTPTVALAAIPILFVAARFVDYTVIHIYSSYEAMPVYTMLWATATGTWIGVMYLWLRPGIPGKALIARAVFFGTVVIGVDLLLFNLVIPLLFEMQLWGMGVLSYADLLTRTAIDLIAISAGAYIVEWLTLKVGNSSAVGQLQLERQA